jgi:hypothetical protein
LSSDVRDRLVIRCEPTRQPHDLDIASGFSFEPAGSTGLGSDRHGYKASGELRDGTMADQSPPAQPTRSSSRPNRARRQAHRSREQGCSRQWNHRGIRAIMSFALDPPLQRSASSIPPQNHGSQQQHSVFTQPGSIASLRASVGHFRSIPHDSRTACLKGAISRRISRFHCCE